MTEVTSLVKAGFKARKAFRNWRNRVRERKGEAPKGVSMLNGKKTYIGIGAVAVGLVLGWLGIGECSPADIAASVCVTSEALTAKIMASLDQVLEVGGLLFAAYGRAKAKPVA